MEAEGGEVVLKNEVSASIPTPAYSLGCVVAQSLVVRADGGFPACVAIANAPRESHLATDPEALLKKRTKTLNDGHARLSERRAFQRGQAACVGASGVRFGGGGHTPPSRIPETAPRSISR